MSLFSRPGFSLYERLERWASSRPNAPFVIEAETGASLSYRAFFDATLSLRRALGSQPRTIALMAPGGLAAAVTWISALTGGHTLVPLAPDAPKAEVERAFTRLQPDLLIGDLEREASTAATRLAPEGVWPLERILAADSAHVAGHLAPPSRPGNLRLFTSGSTGEPKGVSLNAGQIAWTAEQIRISHELSPADRGLTPLPFFHINAPVVSLCASLMAGSSVVIAPRFSRSRFWQWVERYQVTWASLAPTVVALLLRSDPPVAAPTTLRFVRTASAPLPVSHLLEFEAMAGVPVIETYGLTEAASQICANPLPPGRRKPGSVGLPVGVALRLCVPSREGEPLRDVARGEQGEVCVRGPSVIASYVDGASGTAFHHGWFRTGDLGHQDPDGYLYLTGRLRDVINRGGENIAPREVEEALLGCPEISEVAVIGCPDALYGERVVAYVTPVSTWSPELEAALRAFSESRLSAHKRPVDYAPLSAIPRTATGKVDRPRLRWMWERRAGYQAPDDSGGEWRAG